MAPIYQADMRELGCADPTFEPKVSENVNAITGELLRELVLNPHIDYQPTRAPKGPTRPPRK